jgi:hypothetical protein
MDKEIVVYLTSLCVNWAFLGTSVLKWSTRAKKRPNLHTNELNTTFFCSLKTFKISLTFRFDKL